MVQWVADSCTRDNTNLTYRGHKAGKGFIEGDMVGVGRGGKVVDVAIFHCILI